MSRIKVTLEDLFNLPDAVIYNPDDYKLAYYVSTDTRNLKQGSIFVALKGPKFDGHNFIDEAIRKGASTIIINKTKLKYYDHLYCTIVAVKNTSISYGDLAKVWRNKLNTKIVAITGSNGKTSSKEILSTLLQEKYSVAKTVSNNNNHIGVPLTIFNTTNKHDILVLELGTNHFGEIAYTSKIARPDYAVITNIGDSHLEFLVDREGVANEKLALFDAAAENNGMVFINNDDEILKKISRRYKNKITFGLKGKPDVKGTIDGFDYEGKAKLTINYNSKDFKVSLPLYGSVNAKNFLIASAVALQLGLNKKDIINAAGKLKSVDKRLNVKRYNKFTLINDTYNANPESMKSALEFLNSFKSGKRIAILGDMFELGEKGIEAHKALAEHIRKNKINEVYTIGKLTNHLHNEIRNDRIIAKHFINRKLLEKFLMQYELDNSVILVKGSRGMKMEEFVKVLEGIIS